MNKTNKNKLVLPILLAGMVFLTMSCQLFSIEYWVNRSYPEKDGLETEPAVNDNGLKPNNPMENTQQSGVRCTDSPGIAPCPLEACVVTTDQFSAKNVITVELYGKNNPNNFSCCAEFQFNNLSGVDLMAFEHTISEFDDAWRLQYYSKDNNYQPVSCSNYYLQDDGETKYWKGITEIIVIYANPHCDWIEIGEPNIKNFVVPISAVCVP